MTQQLRIKRLTRRGLLVALVLLQDFLPLLGNIPLGPLSITTLPITVTAVAIILGPGEGAFLGGFWGVLTWVRAFTYPSSPLAPLVFTNPLIAILPRILVGVVAGYTFLFLKNRFPRWGAMLAGGLGALTNTVLVLGGIYIFARTSSVASFYHTDVTALGTVLMTIAGSNGMIEMITTAILAPLIALPVRQIVIKGQH
ncbi:ECF transporter S component [Ligilactobacillus saerimneri]|uniref:ECF transporter S component n=1 Tax=Ligilactobacillus saerimneri TaxID=228229 RepID=UPI0024B907E2|nr:ECF transporter S component [Ligilactobacillus saerimneri]